MTHRQLLEHIAKYIEDRIDPTKIDGGFAYVGIMPPLSNRTDFRHFPNGLLPLLGVAPLSISYLDNSLGQYYPSFDIQVMFTNRSPGIEPSQEMPQMLDYTQEIENILIQAVRETLFELPNLLKAVDVVDCMMYPTFYTEVERSRRSYQIGVFVVRLYLGGL